MHSFWHVVEVEAWAKADANTEKRTSEIDAFMLCLVFFQAGLGVERGKRVYCACKLVRVGGESCVDDGGEEGEAFGSKFVGKQWKCTDPLLTSPRRRSTVCTKW